MKIFKIGLLAVVLALGSCKEEVEIDMKDANPVLVVEGEITTETDSSFVKLSLSSNYYSSEKSPVVKTASVSVNGVPFLFDPSKNLYKPALGYVGKTDSVYNLQIDYNSKTYSAQTKLERMFRIDSFFQVWKKAEGFFPEGYSISYAGFDDRPLTKYTYFVNGYYDTIAKRDSFDGNLTLFDNALTPANKEYFFEIPFTRFNTGDIYIAIFRSIDSKMYDFIFAYNSQNPNIPGPFQTPPANLPTNINNGALGYFAAYDVKRWRYQVK